MLKKEFKDIKDSFQELIDDPSFPKNFKVTIEEMKKVLDDDSEDISIRINRIIDDLDDIANDVNVQPFSRTIIFNLISRLESLLHR